MQVNKTKDVEKLLFEKMKLNPQADRIFFIQQL